MAAPRKIFRIEQTAADRVGRPADAPSPSHHAELMNEFAALRAVIAAAMMHSPGNAEAKAEALSASETGHLASDLKLIVGALTGRAIKPDAHAWAENMPPMTRTAHELQEVSSSMGQATRKIIDATEQIDQATKNLSATLKGKYEQDLIQDIQDLVVKVFEACNFQDLAGQRVSKVLSILNFIEGHAVRVLENFARELGAVTRKGGQDLHGPRLDSDIGHVSQAEIDTMFGSPD